MDCYILQTVFLMIMLVFMIDIIYYSHANTSQNRRTYCRVNDIKMENNEFKKVCIKNHYYFDVIISMKQLNLKTLILIISNR